MNHSPPLQGTGRHRVLVVDDEPLIRWSISETLQQEGYEVAEARDAHSALAAISQAHRPFAVVVLDVRLPDSTDLSLLEQLNRTISARIVLITAHGTAELTREAHARGAFSVIDKPFGMDLIARMVDDACRFNGARR